MRKYLLPTGQDKDIRTTKDSMVQIEWCRMLSATITIASREMTDRTILGEITITTATIEEEIIRVAEIPIEVMEMEGMMAEGSKIQCLVRDLKEITQTMTIGTIISCIRDLSMVTKATGMIITMAKAREATKATKAIRRVSKAEVKATTRATTIIAKATAMMVTNKDISSTHINTSTIIWVTEVVDMRIVPTLKERDHNSNTAKTPIMHRAMGNTKTILLNNSNSSIINKIISTNISQLC